MDCDSLYHQMMEDKVEAFLDGSMTVLRLAPAALNCSEGSYLDSSNKNFYQTCQSGQSIKTTFSYVTKFKEILVTRSSIASSIPRELSAFLHFQFCFKH